ncbi:MAG TPA: GNAT family N-acetyltransferase [Pseudonocardia sp.]|nr:GNAT family N-acetyltransferase [Pseudonocardia sp.]
MADDDSTTVRCRPAHAHDAEQVATLHAASWRRHYRGAYAASYLDGDVFADRLAVWSGRLAEPTGSITVLAEDDGGLAGFVHVILDEDVEWGSLIENLHVALPYHRTGIGTTLLACAARGIIECATNSATYLWVLKQNTAAQQFYRARGGACVEEAPVSPPGGVSSRLDGAPTMFRIAWPDASVLALQR